MKASRLTAMPMCRLRLPATDEDGFTIQFWAYSSYGDSSEVFDAQIRVAQTNAGNPDQAFWYVDVLSNQWVGVPVASCVQGLGNTATHRRSAGMAEHAH